MLIKDIGLDKLFNQIKIMNIIIVINIIRIKKINWKRLIIKRMKIKEIMRRVAVVIV